MKLATDWSQSAANPIVSVILRNKEVYDLFVLCNAIFTIVRHIKAGVQSRIVRTGIYHQITRCSNINIRITNFTGFYRTVIVEFDNNIFSNCGISGKMCIRDSIYPMDRGYMLS